MTDTAMVRLLGKVEIIPNPVVTTAGHKGIAPFSPKEISA